jgi:hypothetical protein
MIKTIITGGQYDDPRDYQDDTPQCKNCGMNDKMDDMDVCSGCSDEFDEMDTVSYCCDATIDTDMNLCYACRDHSETALDSYCREHNFNKKTYRYEYSR